VPVDPPAPDCPDKMLYIICAAGAGLILLVVAVVVLARRSRIRSASVRMRFEVVAGSAKMKKEYYLAQEILIGSGRNCDIVLCADESCANARIFKQGQLIYVEDMGSAGGTLLNGMRIFSSNRLRSGDEITVGTTTLRVLF